MHTDDDIIQFVDDDDAPIQFSEEEDSGATQPPLQTHTSERLSIKNWNNPTWKVLIADDEEQIHAVTRFALADYRYLGKKLEFLSAYSGKQALHTLMAHPDTAIILLDVVMESQHAGLEIVEHIRKELGNTFVRIVLRTGQPGQAPEEEVILKYDINDYKNKTELTDKRLFTTITTALRSYADMMEIEHYRQNLEQLVEARTAELVAQKQLVEEKSRQITESISYAKRIQEAILPEQRLIAQVFPEYFIFFRPRDIVSGDFYWFAEKNGKIIFSAIDCTGHGVPGAFMSLIGATHLNEIVLAEGITSPAQILQLLHKRVRHSLKAEQLNMRDGMDMALCVVDPNARLLEFAGAKNPVVYIQDNQMHEPRADRVSIGGEQREVERLFTNHSVSLHTTTAVYMFTDGYPDQFGGETRKKFMSRRLKNLLLEIHHLSMEQQAEMLEETFVSWCGDEYQTDDVLVVGFKI